MQRIIGLLLSGYACKLYAAGLAIWAATEAWTYTAGVFATVHSTLIIGSN